MVRDNPYDRSRNRNRFGNNRIRQDNRQGSDYRNYRDHTPTTRNTGSAQTLVSTTTDRNNTRRGQTPGQGWATNRGNPDQRYTQQQANFHTTATQTNGSQSVTNPTQPNPTQPADDMTNDNRPHPQSTAKPNQHSVGVDPITTEDNTGEQTDYSSHASGGHYRPRQYRPRNSRWDTQQRYTAPQSRQNRPQSRDRQNTRNFRSQQRSHEGYRPLGGYATIQNQNQPGYAFNPPSFLQAPQLQHLQNTPAPYMPPPLSVPPPPSHFYPPYTDNTFGGSQELTGPQWQAMWQSGQPARSFAGANERRRERRNERNEIGQWENEERARVVREQLSNAPRGMSLNERRANSQVACGVNLSVRGVGQGQGHGMIQNTEASNSECVCECDRNKRKKANKDRVVDCSHIVIADSDEKSGPDTEESENEGESVECVSSSEDEREKEKEKESEQGSVSRNWSNDNPGLSGNAQTHIPGSYFGTHSLYDTARVVDITDKVARTVSNPIPPEHVIIVEAEVSLDGKAEESVQEIPPPNAGNVPASNSEREEIDPHTPPVPSGSIASSHSFTETSDLPIQVTTTATIHAPQNINNDIASTGQALNETENHAIDGEASGVTSEGQGHKDHDAETPATTVQSQLSLEHQVEEANARAAWREGVYDKKEASDNTGNTEAKNPRGDSELTGLGKTKRQTLLSPTGKLVTKSGAEDTELSDNAKSKGGKQTNPTSKPKKSKLKKKKVAVELNKQDKQDDSERPKTRSHSQSRST